MLNLEQQANQEEFLTEYFAGIKKGDFYEEPVQGEYPDWQIYISVDNRFSRGQLVPCFFGINELQHFYSLVVSNQALVIAMTEEWKPTADQINGVISSSCEFIKDEANDLLEELQCPPDYIAGILKSIASDFESKEKKDA